MTSLILASLALVLWLYLLTSRGGFWRASEREDIDAAIPSRSADWPHVVAVIPARNEAAVIGESLRSLLHQDYPGTLTIVLVDDHSADRTTDVAIAQAASCRASNRFVALAAPKLPGGWTGKLWALRTGIRYVDSMVPLPDYLLLTDADIQHAPDTLMRLVARARRDGLALISLMAKLHCESMVERFFIPAFVFFFQMLYPFAWVNDQRRLAAAGGCMLVRRSSLLDSGGIDTIRGEVIDDCALARMLGRQGPVWLGLSDRVRSSRTYGSYGDVRSMIIRSAFAELRYSTRWLAFALVAMAIVFIAPPLLAVFADDIQRGIGLLTWALMALAFQPTLRFYERSPLWGIALPAIAGCYMVFTMDSAIQYARGRGGEWKGRAQTARSSKVLQSRR